MIGKNIFKNIMVHIDNVLVNYCQPLAANAYQSSINNYLYIYIYIYIYVLYITDILLHKNA